MAVAPGLSAYLEDLRNTVETALETVISSGRYPAVIAQAMQYSLMGGGKRLRPCLTLAVAEHAGAEQKISSDDARSIALPAACAVEMIHSYSLVHDDLPAMDDDALRRGRPTTHIAYGDGLAILAGDGLLTEAFVVLAHSPSPVVPPDSPAPSPERRLRAIEVLARAAGAAGMVGGQAIDLSAAGRVPALSSPILDATGLEDMHARKTGALIRAAATIGAIVVGASEPAIQAVDNFAREIGLAFQIVDDVLDVEGSREALGKTAGKDAAAGKPTYPALFGVEESRRLAAACVDRAKHALASVGLSGRLDEIADWSLVRRR
ncbi:MAG TPA: farnesyl diphosphate synthase [Vicinamibacterales bacterium]|nr:farnesyl diphosphate synthase [Vicinamibacterales bacterium]